MRNSYLLITSFLLSVMAFAQVPNADFTANNTIIETWDGVDFTDLSTGNPTSWQWSFYGAYPGTSTSQNPTNIYYYYTGTYPVTLTVTNASGTDTETRTGYITVNVPHSKLSSQQCDVSVNLYPGSFYLEPVFIGLQQAEDYRLTIVSNGGPFYYKSANSGSSDPRVSKSLFTGLQYYRNYTCYVQVKFNGVWGSFGPSCNIYTTPNAIFKMARGSSSLLQPLSLDVYPNPSNGEWVNLNITGIHEEFNEVIVTIYDLFGKQVYSKEVNQVGDDLNTRINIENRLSSGVYVLRVLINGQIFSEKLQVR